MQIRRMESGDFAALEDIEQANAEQFTSVGISAMAELGPFSDDDLAGFVRTGLAWVALDGKAQTVGFLVARVVDGCLYISEVGVHPRAARQGIGRQLIDHVATSDYPALTLTTFRDVPWNAPYYERLGFVVLGDDELTPGLRAIRAFQAGIGLDRWPRVCMRRAAESRCPVI